MRKEQAMGMGMRQCAETDEWEAYETAYAFFGNTFLAPMSETGTWGLRPELWRWLEGIDDEGVRQAAEATLAFLESRKALSESELASECSQEHAWLFVGPPKPRICPWETLALAGGRGPLFGKPTADMKLLLAKHELALKRAGKQAEDHMGIEFLYAAKICALIPRKQAEPRELADFLDAHPLRWIDGFVSEIAKEKPHSYYACVSQAARAVMLHHRSQLETNTQANKQ